MINQQSGAKQYVTENKIKVAIRAAVNSVKTKGHWKSEALWKASLVLKAVTRALHGV
jgi:hypothetical protein